jgi:hypothetical protein
LQLQPDEVFVVAQLVVKRLRHRRRGGRQPRCQREQQARRERAPKEAQQASCR